VAAFIIVVSQSARYCQKRTKKVNKLEQPSAVRQPVEAKLKRLWIRSSED